MAKTALRKRASVAHHPHSGGSHEVLHELAGAFLICLILFGVKEWFVEKTEPGRMFEDATYQLLQRRLSDTLGQNSDIPVTVVDISPLETEPIGKGIGTGRATPPRQLLTLLKAIAPAQPAGIAIDVDLFPVNSVDVSPGILDLLKGAEETRRELDVPVVLGIRRTEALAPAYRLGFPHYLNLAASMTYPVLNTARYCEGLFIDRAPAAYSYCRCNRWVAFCTQCDQVLFHICHLTRCGI